ncbi:MAG TPA: AI-2E family transporter [Candidatus Limnocylindrales bacterium]|nr:AI-2E family transporter [Candidatus Limnocylindrales bacterium]
MIVKFQEHPFSFGAIIRIVVSLVAVYLIWKASGILLVILISIMLATALFPVVKKVNQKLPLGISALLVVLLLVLPFFLIGATALPSLISEFPDLLKKVNSLLNDSLFLPESLRNIDFNQYVERGGKYILESTGLITHIISSAIAIFVLTFFLLVDSERLTSIFLSLFDRSTRARVKSLLIKLGEINGQYIRGNLLISLICGVIIYTGLLILQVPYAMPLAIFTAIFDLLPLVGSSIGAIPAVILAFSVSPLTGFLTLALYLIYQQLEGTVIAPAIYNKALKLSPALGFLAVLIGSSLFGIVGAFLALPFAASLPAITDFMHDEMDDK